jgi:hypothetical protein
LSHYQLDVLIFESLSVYLFVVIFVIFLFLGALDSLSGMVVAMVVTGMVVLSALGSERLGSSLLGSRVEILDLSLAEDTSLIIS